MGKKEKRKNMDLKKKDRNKFHKIKKIIQKKNKILKEEKKK